MYDIMMTPPPPPATVTLESRTHIGECEIYKEEQDALEEERRKLDVHDIEEFCRLESSDKTIAVLGDAGRRRRNRTGIG